MTAKLFGTRWIRNFAVKRIPYGVLFRFGKANPKSNLPYFLCTKENIIMFEKEFGYDLSKTADKIRKNKIVRSRWIGIDLW